MSRDRDIVPVEEHDIRIVEALYGEREPEDADAADLAAYDEIRELFGALPEAEPPASVSAKLLAAAAEAASPRPAEREGLWSRLLAWIEPVGRHPALAAVASLVMVVAIGGGLYLSGRSEMAEPEKDVAAPAAAPPSAPAPSADTADTADLPAARESTVAQPAPLDEESPNTESADPLAGAKDDRAKSARPRPASHHAKGTRFESQRTARKPRKRRPAPRRPGRVISGKLDLGGVSDGTRARGNQGPRVEQKEAPAKKAKDKAPRPQGKASGPNPAPQAPPPPTSAPSAGAPSTDDDVDSSARLAGLTARARKTAAAGDCAATRKIGDQVRAADGRYYDTVFLDDGTIAACYRQPRRKPAAH